jgi:hypothetical protein
VLGGEAFAVLAEAVAEVGAHDRRRYAASRDMRHADRDFCAQNCRRSGEI